MRTNWSPRIILFVFLIIHAFLLFYMRLLPFVDLPNHLAEATVFKYADESNLLGRYYKAVPAFYPNTFHTVFCSLFPSVEFGNKVFFVLYVFMLLFSVYLVIKELKGNTWYGVLAVMFIYNFNTTFGFVGFIIAIPATLFLFYLALRDTRKPGFVYTISAAILLVILYLMHAQVALFAMGIYALTLLYGFWKRWGILFLKLIVAVVPVVIMVVIWWWHRAAQEQEQSTISYILWYYKNKYIPEFYLRFKIGIYDHQALREGKLLPLLLNLAVIFPMIYFRVWRFLPKGWKKQRQYFLPVMLFVACFASYMLLPNYFPGQGPIHERQVTLVYLSLIIAGSVLMKDVSLKFLRPYVIGLSLVYTLLWTEHFYTFNKNNKEFTPQFLSGLPPEKKLAGLIYDFNYRGHYIYVHFPNYHIVWNKSLATTKMIDYRFGVVRRAERGGEIPLYQDMIGGRYYKVATAYPDSIHYILQHGKPPIANDSNSVYLQKIKEAGNWALLKNPRLN